LTAGGASTTTPPVDSLVVAGKLTTTASGTFQVEVLVPNLPGGAQTITVSDGVNTGTASFAITPKVAVTFGGNNFGYPEESITPTVTFTGFGSGESVSAATTMWATTTYGCTTGAALGTFGTCAASSGTSVADITGGAKTITATGATSGLTATTTYTVNPWAAFYNSQGGTTSFSFTGSAPTSLLIEVHGLAAGTIAANSITIGGVSTNHQSLVIGATGAYGGAGNFLVVSPTANVPFGPASVVIQGTTFSYAAGNIARGTGTWGGVVISSIVTTNGVGTGVVTTDASSYKPGTGFTSTATTTTAPQQNQIGVFGYGFVNAGAITITASAGLSVTNVLAAGNANTVGAFFATYTLGDTPWSTVSTPTTPATYTLTTSEAAGATPANVLSPTFGITAWVQTPVATSVDYTTNTEAITAHGFSATETLTLTIGGSAMVSGGTCTTTTGTCSTVAGQVPDIAGGAQNAVVTGALSGVVVTSTGAITYHPLVGPTTAGQALSINSGGAGQTSVLRTGVGYGVHGLLANTVYNIVWNAISGSSIVGTFTSTATGGVPIPGTQFTVPSDSSGLHIVVIQTAAGASAIFGSLLLGQTVPSETPFSSADTTGFGDLLFNNIALLQAAPSVAVIGSPEALSGSGLSGGASYVVALGCNNNVAPCAGKGTVLTNAPALATFTATSSGSVPSGTSITLADTPTTLETGTVEYFSIQTDAHYGVSTTSDAYAQFVLAASANLNMTSAPTGHPVVITAHALNSGGAVYNIVFNYVQSSFNSLSYTGTTVGVIAPNSVGAGSATFNVPAGAATGATTVQLVVSTQGTNGDAVGTAVLDTPLSITVGSVSTTSCNTTSCMAATGTPAQGTQGAYSGVTSSFTNNSNAPVTGFVYAVVHNALGQTVDISTATISAPAGGSVSAFNALFGLPPGTYSVSLFVTSSAGTAISSTSTVSVTIP